MHCRNIPFDKLRANGSLCRFNAATVAAFKQEMQSAGANFKVVTYPGVKHSFTNPDADELGKKFGLPLAYNAAADKDSWQQATGFLREVFGKR